MSGQAGWEQEDYSWNAFTLQGQQNGGFAAFAALRCSNKASRKPGLHLAVQTLPKAKGCLCWTERTWFVRCGLCAQYHLVWVCAMRDGDARFPWRGVAWCECLR